MFCPQCGSTQPNELNFCKACGANLGSVRTALEKPATSDEFNWQKTWLAESLMTRDEKNRRRGLTRDEKGPRRGLTPEMKRRREIKAGVITASSGVALTLVLDAIMHGIIIGGGASSAAIAILSRLWIVGLIPIFVGAALIVNGVFVSKRIKGADNPQLAGDNDPAPAQLEFPPRAETNQLPAEAFSVTDETTRHLTNAKDKNKTADLP